MEPLRIAAGEAVEVVVMLEDVTLEVRYLGAGERFVAGDAPSSELPWPEARELVRVTDDGRVLYEGSAIALGDVRVLVRTTSAPERCDLRLRAEWSSHLVSLAATLIVLLSAVGVSVVGPRVHTLALDPELVRITRVELHPPKHDAHIASRSASRFVVTHVNPFARGQTWTGSYDCPQGLTMLALRIESVDGNAIGAVFDFDFAPGNAAGRFELRGTFAPDRGEARFEPGAWLERPPGYYAVGMAGRVSTSAYVGDIVASGCDRFTVRLSQ